MSYSPPQEASEFRGQTLTPVSPKPVHFPSPSNIPILEQSMDPNFTAQVTEVSTQPPVGDNGKATQARAHPYSQSSDLSFDEADGKIVGGAGSSLAYGNGSYAASLAYGNNGASSSQNTYSYAQPTNASLYPSGEAPFAQPLPDSQLASSAYSQLAQAAAYSTAQIQTNAPALQPEAQGVPMGNAELQQLLQNLTSSASATPANSDPMAALLSPTSNVMLPGLNQQPQVPLPGNPNLPPRPPPQEKPATHPNYAPGDDIRQYHPHSQKNPSAAYRAQNSLPPISTSSGSGSPMQPSQGSAFQQQTPQSAMPAHSPNTPNPSYRQRESVDRRDHPEDPDAPWGPDLERMFNEFLVDERQYVTEGQWDKFPVNSRLFIGMAHNVFVISFP